MGSADKPKGMIPPPVYFAPAKRNRLVPLAIFAQHLLASVVTIAAAAVAFDTLCYVFLKRTLIFKQLGVLFAWLFTYGDILFPSAINRLAGGSFLVILTFPFVLFFSKAVARGIRFSYLRIPVGQRKRATSLPPLGARKIEEIKRFLRSVCEEFKLPVPRLVVDERAKLPVCVEGRLIAKTCVLRLNRRVVESLSAEELKAAVAHELGHLSQGLRKIEWLKFLSVMTVSSNYCLTLCLDPIQSELEADRFALKSGVDPDALLRAIVKSGLVSSDTRASLWEHLGSRIRKAAESLFRVRGLDMANEFFFGDGFVGYSYPALAQRLEYLERVKTGVVEP